MDPIEKSIRRFKDGFLYLRKSGEKEPKLITRQDVLVRSEKQRIFNKIIIGEENKIRNIGDVEIEESIINGQTTIDAVADDDELLIYDSSLGLLRKVLVSDISGDTEFAEYEQAFSQRIEGVTTYLGYSHPHGHATTSSQSHLYDAGDWVQLGSEIFDEDLSFIGENANGEVIYRSLRAGYIGDSNVGGDHATLFRTFITGALTGTFYFQTILSCPGSFRAIVQMKDVLPATDEFYNPTTSTWSTTSAQFNLSPDGARRGAQLFVLPFIVDKSRQIEFTVFMADGIGDWGYLEYGQVVDKQDAGIIHTRGGTVIGYGFEKEKIDGTLTSRHATLQEAITDAVARDRSVIVDSVVPISGTYTVEDTVKFEWTKPDNYIEFQSGCDVTWKAKTNGVQQKIFGMQNDTDSYREYVFKLEDDIDFLLLENGDNILLEDNLIGTKTIVRLSNGESSYVVQWGLITSFNTSGDATAAADKLTNYYATKHAWNAGLAVAVCVLEFPVGLCYLKPFGADFRDEFRKTGIFLMKGQGERQTLIVLGDNENSKFIRCGRPSSDWHNGGIIDMTVAGNRQNQTSYTLDDSCIEMNGFDTFVMNCHIRRSPGIGLHLTQGQNNNCHLSNVEFEDIGGITSSSEGKGGIGCLASGLSKFHVFGWSAEKVDDGFKVSANTSSDAKPWPIDCKIEQSYGENVGTATGNAMVVLRGVSNAFIKGGHRQANIDNYVRLSSYIYALQVDQPSDNEDAILLEDGTQLGLEDNLNAFTKGVVIDMGECNGGTVVNDTRCSGKVIMPEDRDSVRVDDADDTLFVVAAQPSEYLVPFGTRRQGVTTHLNTSHPYAKATKVSPWAANGIWNITGSTFFSEDMMWLYQTDLGLAVRQSTVLGLQLSNSDPQVEVEARSFITGTRSGTFYLDFGGYIPACYRFRVQIFDTIPNTYWNPETQSWQDTVKTIFIATDGMRAGFEKFQIPFVLDGTNRQIEVSFFANRGGNKKMTFDYFQIVNFPDADFHHTRFNNDLARSDLIGSGVVRAGDTVVYTEDDYTPQGFEDQIVLQSGSGAIDFTMPFMRRIGWKFLIILMRQGTSNTAGLLRDSVEQTRINNTAADVPSLLTNDFNSRRIHYLDSEERLLLEDSDIVLMEDDKSGILMTGDETWAYL